MGENRIHVPGLEDANLAGTAEACNCTLVLTAGRAAASLIAAGVVMVGGRDRYGIYAIGGDMINARRNQDETRLDPVVNAIRRAVGLEFDQVYENDEAFGALRYGRVMLAAGQVGNGSKVKGLVVNLFHACWPSLLQRRGFLVQLITPAVKVFHPGGEERFYSMEDFRGSRFYRLKQHLGFVREYKSLETVSPQEMRQYFSRLPAHCIQFLYEVENDDRAIERAFNVDDDRKAWLEDSLQEVLLNESPLYTEGMQQVTYNYFIDREYALCCSESVERAIPSAVDGLTRNQRKVLHTCLRQYPEQEVNVLQLVGSVFEVSAYRNSTEALGDTVVGMAQDYVGRGNVNLLLPLGQFGTRMKGGKDAGNVQFLHTKLNGIIRLLFPEADLDIVEYRRERGRAIEPRYFLPVIPLILVNGAFGIGTGWMTKIPKYHPKHVIENLLRMLDDDEPQEMTPWFRNFHGTIEKRNDNQCRILGSISILGPNTFRITELPVGSWTHKYRDRVLERMVAEGIIVGYDDRHTDTTVDFMVTYAGNLPENNTTLLQEFDLIKTEGYTFAAYDHTHTLRGFGSATDILRYFFDVRLPAYEARRQHMMGKLRSDLRAMQRLQVSREERTIRIERGGERVSIHRESVGEEDGLDDHGNEARRILNNFWHFAEMQWMNFERNREEAEQELNRLENMTARELWRQELHALLERSEIRLEEDNADGLAEGIALLEL